jgi:outer membrane receptor protein involved in Fe transport
MLMIWLLTLILGPMAVAQIQNEPTEIVTATPLSSFSERAGFWPSTEISRDALGLDAAPLRDRLNTLPGIQARESGSPTVSIRGSAQADRVLELFDGIPLNMGDGVGASTLFIPEEVLSETDIMKGPASVFYGSSAMGGSLDHRLRLFDRPAMRLGIADDGGWLGPREGLLVTPIAVSNDGRGQASLFYQEKPGRTPYTSTSTGKSGRLENNADELTRATGSWQNKSGPWDFSSRLIAAHEVSESPGSVQTPISSTSDLNGTLISAEAGRKIFASPIKHAGVRVADSRIWGIYDHGRAFESSSYVGRTQVSADLHSAFSNDDIQSRTFTDFVSDDLKATYLGSAHFIENSFEPGELVDFSLNPTLTVTPGVRYISAEGAWVKSIGALYNLDHQKTWLTWSEGFRRPSLSDRFTNLTSFQGNPSLKPERSQSVELGFEEEKGKRFHGFFEGFAYGLAVFDTHYDDLIDTKNLSATQSTKVNAGQARIFGYEGHLAYSIKIWTLSGSYSHLEGKNESVSEPLRLTPEHQWAFAASQQLGPAVIELKETIWSSFYDRDASNSLVERPSWQTLDFNIRTIGLSDWEFSAGVLNIFDQPRELTIGYPEPQRRFFASALRYF